MTLEQIAAELHRLDSAQDAAQFAKAKLVHEARERFDNTESWFAWMSESTRYGRRTCFEYLAVGTIVAELVRRAALDKKSALADRLVALPFRKVVILASLPAEKIQALLDNHDLAGMSREELRALVSGKPVSRDLKRKARLPKIDAEQLELALGDEAAVRRIDEQKEFKLCHVFWKRSIAKAKQSGDAQFLKGACKVAALQWKALVDELHRLHVPEREIPGMR